MNAGSGAVVSLAAALFLAVTGYFATYAANISLRRREGQLSRINAQLQYLYGPLVANLDATELLFDQWRVSRLLMPGGWVQATAGDREQWRHWMRTVFLPTNEQMLGIVWEHAHLVEGNDLPPELQVLCAHIIAYRGLLASWDEGDYSQVTPPILFPSVVRQDVHRKFLLLKNMQDQILSAKFWQVWLPRTPSDAQVDRLMREAEDRRAGYLAEHGSRYFREAKTEDYGYTSIFDRAQWRPWPAMDAEEGQAGTAAPGALPASVPAQPPPWPAPGLDPRTVRCSSSSRRIDAGNAGQTMLRLAVDGPVVH